MMSRSRIKVAAADAVDAADVGFESVVAVVLYWSAGNSQPETADRLAVVLRKLVGWKVGFLD